MDGQSDGAASCDDHGRAGAGEPGVDGAGRLAAQMCGATYVPHPAVCLACDGQAGHGGPHEFVWWDDDAGAVPASEEAGLG